jgi:hypothetical protein
MLISWPGGPDMSTTGRIVAGIVVAVCLLGLAALDLVSERVRVDPAPAGTAPAYLADPQIPEGIERIVVLGNGRQEGESSER